MKWSAIVESLRNTALPHTFTGFITAINKILHNMCYEDISIEFTEILQSDVYILKPGTELILSDFERL
jgi:hypothetical protein